VPSLTLIACSDDFLLEDSVNQAVASACAGFGGVEPEVYDEGLTADSLAVELCSPSLFSPSRVLVVPEVRPWLEAAAPAGAPDGVVVGDPSPLLAVIQEGLSEEIALVMGAWCRSKPKGPLVEAITASGDFRWIPLPEPPKPWEDVPLSKEQRCVLKELLDRVVGEVRFTTDAEVLLLERLGFAPRLLVQEARKLVAAAGEQREVDEELVRQLTFPRERSLEVVRDAVLQRDVRALLDLVDAAAAGVPVSDWRGQRLDPMGVAIVLCGQVFNLLEQLLYLRQAAIELGLEGELDRARTGDRGWYRRRFKPQLAERIIDHLMERSSPLTRGGKTPSAWALGQLFEGASRYRGDELAGALADGGEVEAALRGPMALAALSSWITRSLETSTA
jgi:hypothetical protein